MKRYVALLTVILLSCSKDSSVFNPPGSEESNEIVFISRRIENSADWQLYIMNPDGTEQRKLTDDIVTCQTPVVSPDGENIAYTTYQDNTYKLWVVDRNGGNKKPVAEHENHITGIAWSPDNQTIAFVKSYPYNHIYTANIISGIERRSTDGEYDYSPAFLDNNTIIYTSAADIYSGYSGIYSIDLNGGNKKLLTPEGKYFSMPRISPDKKMIAMVQPSWEGSQIYTMRIDGSHLKQLTNTAASFQYPGSPRDGNRDPQWSPDSKRLVYVSYAVNGSPDIFAMDPDGKNNKILTDGIKRDESPSWSADGSHILFSSNSNPEINTEIYIMTGEGRNPKPLTKHVYDDVFPVFLKANNH